MNRLLPWILRLFISGVLAVIFFCLAVNFFLENATDNAPSVVFTVIIPLGTAILLGFLLPSVVSNQRWRHKWLPTAEGTKEIFEFELERYFKTGLRAILNPINLPTAKLEHLRQYSLLWAKNLLKSRQRDDWCWELYTMVLPDFIENPEHLKQLRMLIVESDTLSESGFHTGLELFSLFPHDRDLAWAIARAGIDYDKDLLPQRLRIVLEASLLEPSKPSKLQVRESREEALISEIKPSHLPTEFETTVSEASFGDFSTSEVPQSAEIMVMRRDIWSVLHRIKFKFIIIFALVLLIIAGSYVIFSQMEQRTKVTKTPLGMYRPGRVSSQQPYTVQVAAHSSLERAIEHIKILRRKGVNVYLVQPQEGTSKWFRVRFGEFNSPSEAKLTADSLKTHGIIQEFFVTQFEPGVLPEDVVK